MTNKQISAGWVVLHSKTGEPMKTSTAGGRTQGKLYKSEGHARNAIKNSAYKKDAGEYIIVEVFVPLYGYDVYAEVLDYPMAENDAGEENLRGYLNKLFFSLLDEGEGFNSKRPFGNSGWQYEIYQHLVRWDVIDGELDEDGGLMDFNREHADEFINDLLAYLMGPR
jgi:hypothetical protein